MVALAATISVVFTTCSNDDEKPTEIDNSYFIKDIFWYSYINEEGHYDSRYGIKFNSDGTYSYTTPTESFAGNYKISETLKSTGVLSSIWNDNEFEEEYDYSLFKMNVTGSSDFDQLWVYHVSTTTVSRLIVHFYTNNVLVRKPFFIKY